MFRLLVWALMLQSLGSIHHLVPTPHGLPGKPRRFITGYLLLPLRQRVLGCLAGRHLTVSLLLLLVSLMAFLALGFAPDALWPSSHLELNLAFWVGSGVFLLFYLLLLGFEWLWPCHGFCHAVRDFFAKPNETDEVYGWLHNGFHRLPLPADQRFQVTVDYLREETSGPSQNVFEKALNEALGTGRRDSSGGWFNRDAFDYAVGHAGWGRYVTQLMLLAAAWACQLLTALLFVC